VESDKSISEAMTGKAVIIYDAASDPRAPYPEALAEEGISSITSIPIVLKGNVIGVLRLYSSQPRSYSEEEVMFMTSLAEQAALALENARMYQKLKQEHEELMSDLYRFSGFTRSI
jgi:GAF domain-containing protein